MRIGQFHAATLNIVFIFGALMLGFAAHAEALPCQGVVDLTVNKKHYQIPVEIAQTDEERGRGLMFRQELNGAGMLFAYPEEKLRAFWMKNTPLPLDALFIGQGGRSIVLYQSMQPYNTNPPYPSGLASLVLEVEEGLIDWADEGGAPDMALHFSTTTKACADFVTGHELYRFAK